MRYGKDYRYIEYEGEKYEIDYSHSKGYVHAYVHINGKRIIVVDTRQDYAFWALQQHVYQELDLPKDKHE